MSENKNTPQDVRDQGECSEIILDGKHTINQIRKMWGLEPLSDEICNVLLKMTVEE